MCAGTRRLVRARRRGGGLPNVAVLALATFALPALAQFPDVLSESECPGCEAQLAPSPFDGTWSSPLTAGGESGWALEDYFCFAACTAEGRALFVVPVKPTQAMPYCSDFCDVLASGYLSLPPSFQPLAVWLITPRSRS